MDDSELLGVTCTAGDCLNEAAGIGHATFKVDPLVGAVPSEQVHTFALPMCIEHAHLLRMNNTLVEFDDGMR